MRLKNISIIIVCAFWAGCSSNQLRPAEDALDVVREFEDACLKGDFDKADYYLLKNPGNSAKLQAIQKEYNGKAAEVQKQLREASIIIISSKEISKTNYHIILRNSYDKKTDTLQAVQQNNNWLVDFK